MMTFLIILNSVESVGSHFGNSREALVLNINLSTVSHNPFDNLVIQLVSCGLSQCPVLGDFGLAQAGCLTRS